MSAANVPRWLPWTFVLLLVLPFHPLWIDFEQVRRALLLVLTGVVLLAVPALPRPSGSRAMTWFFAWFAIHAAVEFVLPTVFADDPDLGSFQPWEAVWRLAHWLALGVVLRLGAASPASFGSPMATALLATSCFGLLQRLGIAAIGSYGLAHEPVSTFGNLNVAAEWTAIAAAAVAVLDVRPRWLRFAALIAAGAYVVVDQSRSALVALPIGLLLLWSQRRAKGWQPLASCLLGAAIGAVLLLSGPRPADRGAAEQTAAEARSVATLQVRFEIAKGCMSLFAESPVWGHGAGQFQVQYPRVRTQAEIELSSNWRSFATEVRTAHDDWLEVLVDGGAVALLLLAWTVWSLWRGALDKARLVPLAVLLLMMLARSPLWNAPAAVAALLLAGTAAAPTPPTAGRRIARATLGAVLAALGLLPLVAHWRALDWLAADVSGALRPPGALASASAWMPWEPRWKQLLAQEQLASHDFATAALTAAEALHLRPFDPPLHLLLGEILARGSQFAEAETVARRGIRFDPPNPELRQLLSAVLAQRNKIDGAILAAVEAPHPKLRAQLARHFGDLAALAARRGDEAGAARFRIEQAYVRTADALADRSPGGSAAAAEHVKLLLQALRDAGRQRQDVRGFAASAVLAHTLDDDATAASLGEETASLGVPFPAWQQALLGGAIEPLRTMPSWQPLLRP